MLVFSDIVEYSCVFEYLVHCFGACNIISLTVLVHGMFSLTIEQKIEIVLDCDFIIIGLLMILYFVFKVDAMMAFLVSTRIYQFGAVGAVHTVWGRRIWSGAIEHGLGPSNTVWGRQILFR